MGLTKWHLLNSHHRERPTRVESPESDGENSRSGNFREPLKSQHSHCEEPEPTWQSRARTRASFLAGLPRFACNNDRRCGCVLKEGHASLPVREKIFRRLTETVFAPAA